MSSQLDILALEPFYGGVRKAMLETVMRVSRHRWTLLKLPPRRMERRLTLAAHWFAEQLSRHWAGRLDILFTSEAINLFDLKRVLPDIASKPSVVYFHENQLPAPDRTEPTKNFELVNLSTAQAATEMWFNSEWHRQNFFRRANGLVQKYPELSSRRPIPEMQAKSRVLHPPVQLHFASQWSSGVPRDSRTILTHSYGNDLKLLNLGLSALKATGEKFNVINIGPAKDISDQIPHIAMEQLDETALADALSKSSLYVSALRTPPTDPFGVLAAASRCWPIVPDEGFYSEIIPSRLLECCLYNGTPEGLANQIADAWHMYQIEDLKNQADMQALLKPYDVVAACRAIDERLDELAMSHSFTG